MDVLTQCPQCKAQTAENFLGQLGSLVWFRCRFCGAEYSIPADDITEDQDNG